MRRLSRGSGDESGSALVLVIGSMLILAMMAMTGLAYTLHSQKFARYDQDYSAAMAAAQSGVDDFVSRLNRDDNYGSAVDCTNLAWQGTNVAPACSWGPSTTPGWLPVDPGVTDPAGASFHYAVDATARLTEGKIVITSTGRVNGQYRTIQAAVGKGSSTDYVYYTNFESADPANVQAYPTSPSAVCGGTNSPAPKYWYSGRNAANPRCSEIEFAPGDVLNGPVFSNDAIFSDNASFMKGIQSANPSCGAPSVTGDQSTWYLCLRNDPANPGIRSARFNNHEPLLADPLYLNDTAAAFATNPGCHYYGSTRIVLNSNGTMTVWNPTSVNNNQAPFGIAPPGGAVPSCGTVAEVNQKPGGFTTNVPSNMVVYVAASSAPMRQCYGQELGGPSGHALPLGTYSSTTPQTPVASTPSYTVDTNMTETTKLCAQGNLYVEGTLKGRLTLSAAQSIIVTGDLVLAGGTSASSPDMLGLVATNSVEVFHPQLATVTSTVQTPGCHNNCAYQWTTGTGSDVTGWPYRYADPTTGGDNPAIGAGVQIAGSIQTLQHSFYVQKYSVGANQGTLLVNGSIAQQWRGIVGTPAGTGYTKLYQYDTRLQFSSPPYFPWWASSQWKLRYSGEMNTPTGVKSP
jgi:Tfp pilus assembly protein PilX